MSVVMPEEPLKQDENGAELKTDFNYKVQIVWINVFLQIIFHSMVLYGLYLHLFVVCWKTFFYGFVVVHIAYFGTTIGAHRFYSHRSFQAHFIVRSLLVILQTMTGQDSVYTWVRDHRAHHKYLDTDADPYNAKRGLFFSHVGWLLVKKHPDVAAKGKTIDLSDLKADPLVMFQKKYYIPLYLVFSIYIPTAIPMYFWNETFVNSFFTAYILRYGITLHITWSINSFAHKYGMRPYNRNITATNLNLARLFTLGEAWHNYHHVFPSDYRSSEIGLKYNFSSYVIELFAFLGLAYNLRSAPENVIKVRLTKYGDGSRLHLY